MIKTAQGTEIGTLMGLFIWGALMDLACYFNLKWAFWGLIIILVIGVIWFMIWWPFPKTTRTIRARAK